MYKLPDLNKKWLPYIIIIILGAAVLFIKKCKSGNQNTPQTTVKKDRKDPASTIDRDRGFDRRISYLEYSKHDILEYIAILHQDKSFRSVTMVPDVDAV